MSAGPLLQVLDAWEDGAGGEARETAPTHGAAAYTLEGARVLGGAVVSLTSAPAPPPGLEGRGYSPAPGEGALTVWHRALEAVRPGAVFVQSLGGMNPALLLDLRERGIPYAVFLHDFAALCPTRRLWRRGQEICSGPGKTGLKCAWCAAPGVGWPAAGRRLAELPLRTLLYRHRPQNWRTALLRADALLAPSRFARDFWIEQGAPPERLALFTPLLPAPDGAPASPPPAAAAPGSLLFAGTDEADGFEMLAAALDAIRQPQRLVLTAHLPPDLQAGVRAAIASRHDVAFAPGARSGPGDVVVLPARWDPPSPRAALAAQRAGAVVVAAAVGGWAETILHGVNGFLAGRDDPAALAEAIVEARQQSVADGAQVPVAGGEPPWAGTRVREQVEAAAAAEADRLRRLLDLLRGGETEVALELGHGAWLDSLGADRAAARASLITALRLQPLDVAPPANDAPFARRAVASTRSRRLALNHAIAFFRGCGCRRIAPINGTTAPAADAREWFAAWGLELVAAEALPDGLFLDAAAGPAGEEEDVASVPSPGLNLLRRRFPQARAWVAARPQGVEVHTWL